MEEKSDKNTPKEYTFEAICYSTNYKNFSSMKVLNQYFMSAECQEINHIDEFNVTFNKKLKIADNKEIECMNSYFEIVPTKSIKLKKTADCFIIFFDLEYNDSLGELNKIIKNLANLGTNDKKLIIVRFYMEEKDIKTNSDEKSIPNILDKYGFSIFDISKINLNSPEQIISTIDKITLDTLQDKNLIQCDNLDDKNDKSESFCLIN